MTDPGDTSPDPLIPDLLFTEGELKVITLGLGLFMDSMDPAVHPVAMLLDANAAATKVLAFFGESLPPLDDPPAHPGATS